VYPQIKAISSDCVRSTWSKLDPQLKHHNIQVKLIPASLNPSKLFGLDFMIDSELRVWLIEANNNPGLSECKSTTLGRVLN